MASLSWDLTRRDGVTLVELVVTADTEERVRVVSRLQPVWPPRRQGVPVAGWDDARFEGRVEPGDPLVLGFASPAAPVDPPAHLESIDADESTTGVTPRAIVRTLGENAPPRDVVPADLAGTDARPQATAPGPTATPEAAAPGQTNTDGRARTIETADSDETIDSDGPPDLDETVEPDGPPDLDEAIDPWFDAVEERVDEAERLAAVAGVEEAHSAVTAVGGIDAARELHERLDADRRQLEALRARQQRLADRLDAVEIPLSTLERVT